MAFYLAGSEARPGLALCSPARRSRDTLAPLRRRLGPRLRTRFEQGLYLATAEALIARLRRLSARERSVLVVGHDPGLHDLAVALAGRGPTDAVERLRAKLPTGALVVLDLAEHAWRELAPGCARLVEFSVPRDLV